MKTPLIHAPGDGAAHRLALVSHVRNGLPGGETIRKSGERSPLVPARLNLADGRPVDKRARTGSGEGS